MDYVLARFRAPPYDKSLLIAAREATKRSPLAISYEPSDVPMECFNNVANRCRSEGGMAICGWSLLSLKRSISKMTAIADPKNTGVDLRGISGVELETHCIWQRPDGHYVDVTPTEGGASCRFVRDDRVSHGASVYVVVFPRKKDRDRYRRVLAQLDAFSGRHSHFVERNF